MYGKGAESLNTQMISQALEWYEILTEVTV